MNLQQVRYWLGYMLKIFARDKCSSLFCFTVSDEDKSFMPLTPGFNVIKLVSFAADDEAK